jgi:hypothetical protein
MAFGEQVRKLFAATPNATTKVRSYNSSSGVAARCRSFGSRPDITRMRCARVGSEVVIASARSGDGEPQCHEINSLLSKQVRESDSGLYRRTNDGRATTHRCRTVG